MNYGTLELEIVTQLNNQFAANNLQTLYEARVQPDTDAEFNRAFTKSRVTVAYLNSDYAKPSSTAQVSQLETVRVRLSFEARRMRGEGGFFNMLDHVKNVLVGFRPTNGDRMYISKYDLQEVEQNSWMPFIEMECPTMVIQQDEDEPTLGGTFQKISLKEVLETVFDGQTMDTQLLQ